MRRVKLEARLALPNNLNILFIIRQNSLVSIEWLVITMR
jgi:hypothetical protein